MSTNTVCATRVFVLQSLINGSVPSLSREAEVSRGGVSYTAVRGSCCRFISEPGKAAAAAAAVVRRLRLSTSRLTTCSVGYQSLRVQAARTHARTPPVKYLASHGRTDGTPPRGRNSQTRRRDCRPNVPGVQRVRRVRRTSASGSVREDVCNNSKNRKKSRFSRF